MEARAIVGVTRSAEWSRRRLAFSAVELLIVLTIIGLIAAFSMPRISTVVGRDRVRRAQFIVGSELERAFQYAARVRRPLTVTLNSSTKAFAVTDRSSGTVYYSRDLSRTSTWALTNATISPSTGVTIFPTGLASAAVTVTLTHNGYTKTVSATIVGHIIKN